MTNRSEVVARIRGERGGGARSAATLACVGIALVIILLAAGCSTEKRDWEAAEASDSVTAYKQYVWKYPEGEHVADAEKKIEELEFLEAARIDSRDAYASYLQRYPDGPYSGPARKRWDDLDWKSAEARWSRVGWQEYLAGHPDGSHAEEAKSRIEQLESDRLPELRGVKTVGIQVRQSFDEVVKDVDIGFDEQLGRILSAFGLEKVDPETKPDATLSVRAYAEAWGDNYSQFGIGWGTYYYTGARVRGRVSIEVDGRQLVFESFDGNQPTPYSISGGSTDPSDAPYSEAMEKDFPRKATKLLARAFGYRPLIGSMGGGTDGGAAIHALSGGGEAVRGLLLEALSIPNVQIRAGAAEALAGHKSAEVADALVECLGVEGDGEVNLRLRASESLSELGAVAMPALRNAMRDDRAIVREGVARSLGGIRTSDSLAMLVGALDDQAEEVRTVAIASLGEHRNRAAVAVLLDRVETADETRRGAFLDAVSMSAAYDPELETEGVSWNQDLVESLVSVITLPGLDQKKMMALFEVIGSTAVGPLSRSLKSEDPAVRRAVVEALGRSGGSGSLRYVESAVEDPDTSVRLQVAKSLPTYDDVSIIRPLAALLADRDQEIRSAALTGLPSCSYLDGAKREYRRHLSRPETIASLIEVMKGSDQTNRGAAVQLLGQVGGPAIDPLIGLAKSGIRPGCGEALDALGATGDERAIQALIDFSENPAVRSDDELMMRLYGAMGRTESSKTMSCLAKGLDDASVERQIAAINALRQLDDVHAVDDLVRVMGRGNSQVDAAIVGAIQDLTHHYPDDSDFDWKEWWQKSRAEYGVKGR